MKCFVCGSDTPGEVCNQCVRTEKNLFHKEWDYKEGFLVKKVDSYRVDVTTYRITGTGMITSNNSGLNGRVDGFNHYIGNIESIEKKPCNGKDAVLIHYRNANTQMERFVFLLGFDAESGLRNAVDSAKKELKSGGGAAAGMSPDVANKLNKLKVLLESGILSQDEFEKEKAKLGL